MGYNSLEARHCSMILSTVQRFGIGDLPYGLPVLLHSCVNMAYNCLLWFRQASVFSRGYSLSQMFAPPLAWFGLAVSVRSSEHGSPDAQRRPRGPQWPCPANLPRFDASNPRLPPIAPARLLLV